MSDGCSPPLKATANVKYAGCNKRFNTHKNTIESRWSRMDGLITASSAIKLVTMFKYVRSS